MRAVGKQHQTLSKTYYALPQLRAYFNVQLITICAVVKSNVQLLHCQLADCLVLCSCKSCLKNGLPHLGSAEQINTIRIIRYDCSWNEPGKNCWKISNNLHLLFKLTDSGMITRIVWTDDHKLLQAMFPLSCAHKGHKMGSHNKTWSA